MITQHIHLEGDMVSPQHILPGFPRLRMALVVLFCLCDVVPSNQPMDLRNVGIRYEI